tara:strand:- start:569 stop:1117 length:549 start_codon:yes stop_codon:yes gene_type:complete
MKSKPASFSETTITELMIPSYANFSGKIHGGILLSLMDKVAFACASKHSGEYCVTVSVEGVEFFQPVEVGELVSLTGSVIYVGKTSMIVGIHIESMKPKTGETKHTNDCYFTMVAKNEAGEKTTVPSLAIENIKQLKRFVEGKEIKKFSRKKRKLLDMGIEAYNKEDLINACLNERCDVSKI